MKYRVVKVADILPMELIATEDPEMVLIEGELWKFHPGFNQYFFSKWCTVTKGSFQYYKTKLAANCFVNSPVGCIPIASIKSVQRVSVLVPEEPHLRPQTKHCELNKFQFEIFLNEDIAADEIGSDDDVLKEEIIITNKPRMTEARNKSHLSRL